MKLLIGILFCAYDVTRADVDVSSLFHEKKVVPDVMDIPPNEALEVIYDGKPLIPGDIWTPYGVRNIPNVTWPADPDKYYTVLEIGLDFPSPAKPKFRSSMCWLVVNIPGNDICKGETLTVYTGTSPGKGVGLVRMIFLLFEHPAGKIDFNEPFNGDRQVGSRLSWSLRDFMAKYHLGSPVRGSLYRAEYDEYGAMVAQEFRAGKRSQTQSIIEYEHCKK